jgi:MFS family permease
MVSPMSRPDPATPRRPARLALLTPLRRREFALLWSGMTVSLLGDGIYFVAIAWQVYALSNAPTALSVVGAAWTLPTVVFLLFGGAVSDRAERRLVLLVASLLEATAIAAIGVLSLTGALTLWMLLVLVAVYGSGVAFFNPAFSAIVPTLVGPEEFTAASALDNFVRPLAVQLVGPAVGGLLVAVVDPGVAFLVDAGTFLIAVACLSAMRRTPRVSGPARSLRGTVRDVAEGFAFVRSQPWLWATLAAASLSLLAFYGPYQVLLPFLVKNRLHAGGETFGVVRAAAGVGALAAALTLAQRGLPRRCVTAMFVAWTLESALLIGFALATGAWVFAVVSLLSGGLAAMGGVVWGTLMNTFVPDALRGRVSSFDWFVSIGLIPVSFAVTGPIAAALGARATLLGAGVLGAIAMLAFLLVPGVREPETRLATGAGVPAAVHETG